ncbi:single-stranded DNA-binding protein, mitochondrial-like [Lineus longissimus]|uniref:single-stranded DNA-binding protein, mitochondrial-like n=1 Tax=Lineus longissimus TaxID=88925 RepID=UPI002B4F6D5F
MLKRVLGPLKTIRAVGEITRCYCEAAQPEMGERRMASEKCINQVNLMGRVGRDPEVRGSEDKPVIVFTLATNTSYPKDNEFITRTDWHRISVFNRNVVQSVAMNIRKGDRLFVNGKIRYDDYMDQRTGQKTRSCSIVANEVVNLTKKYLEDSSEFEEN